MEQEHIGLIEEAPGVKSTGRVVTLIGCVLGAVIATAGVVLAFMEALRGTGTAHGLALAGLGAGMYTSGALTKAWSKQAEAKVEAAMVTVTTAGEGGR